MKFSLLILLLLNLTLNAVEYKEDEDSYKFEARIAATNSEGSLIRLKTNFDNAKFITDRDYLVISRDQYHSQECLGKLVARSPDYILLKLTSYGVCQRAIGFSEGSLVSLTSEDLKKNIQSAKTLIEVLLKKRMALRSKIMRVRSKLKIRDNRESELQYRFQQLMSDLERKRDQQVNELRNEFLKEETDLKELQMRLNETVFKIEKYKVSDHNLKEDRWSLDSFIYNKN